jgi:hypothetical protein
LQIRQSKCHSWRPSWWEREDPSVRKHRGVILLVLIQLVPPWVQLVRWVKLWMELKDISTYDILNSVWEELWIANCTKWLICENSDICSTTTLFWNLQKTFNQILKLQTLDKIIK